MGMMRKREGLGRMLMCAIAAVMLTLTMQGTTVFAVSPLSVVSLPSEADLAVQVFSVSNPNASDVSAAWGCAQTGEAGSLNVPAGGSDVFTVSDPGMTGRTVYITYDNGGIAETKYCGSSNRYMVYTEYVDENGSKLFSESSAVSKAEGSISVSAPETFTSAAGDSYKLTSQGTRGHIFNPYAAMTERTLVFTYKKVVPEPYSIKIVCINAATNLEVFSEVINVPVGGSASVTPRASVTTGASIEYALRAGQPAETHSYGDAKRQYDFYYDQVIAAQQKPYAINIKFTDSATGYTIASKNVTVPVKSTVTYAVPASYTTSAGKEYERVAGEPDSIVHRSNDVARAYTVLFKEVSGSASPYEITINYADALTGAVIKAEKLSVGKNATVSHDAPSTFKIGTSTEYYIADGQQRMVTHQFGASKRVYTIYYNSGAATPVQPYNISMRYLTHDTNAMIYETIVTVPVRQSVFHQPPKYINDAAGNYLTLANGQEDTVIHKFGESLRIYNFFYRPLTDLEADDIVINPPAGGGGGAGTTVVAPDEELDEIISNITPEKDDTATVIEDNETPLAPGQKDPKFSFSDFVDKNRALIAAAAAALLLMAIAIIEIRKRRSRR